MFGNFIKITLRNLGKSKVFSFINILGLALGMACTILISMWVLNEFNYDRYHAKAKRIFRVGTVFDIGSMYNVIASSNYPLGPTLKADYPEVREAVRFRPFSRGALVRHEDKRFFEEGILYADNSVFNVFDYSLLKGDPQTALAAAMTIVISENTARKYFGEENPIGKTLDLDNGQIFTVTGVLQNVPVNSHLRFDMLCSFETLIQRNPEQTGRWMGDFDNYTYVLLNDETDRSVLESKFPALIDAQVGQLLSTVGGKMEYFLQPLTSIHLHSRLENEISANGNITYVYTFIAIALFILFIACFNFMNLATARTSNRSREVAMRKVLGASRSVLIRQFIGESTIFAFLALIIALFFVELFQPVFNRISGNPVNFNMWETYWLLPALVGLTLFVGIVAGSYPALLLSSFHSIRVLKGLHRTGPSSARFRSVLIVVQFTISIALIAATLIMVRQIRFMKHKQLGFDREHVLILALPENVTSQAIATIKAEFKQHTGIVNAALSSHLPSHGGRHNAFFAEGKSYEESEMIAAWSIDPDFLPTLDIALIGGRNFSTEFSTDIDQAVIINETAARKFGWDDPIGKTITELDGNATRKRVIGIVKDFHMRSLHSGIEPLYIEYKPADFGYFCIRLKPDQIAETMQFIGKRWKQIDPGGTFDYSFLDTTFDNQYRKDEKLSRLLSYFTLIAIFIACLGLFGLASFSAERRTKEIGIRKVLGASVGGIIRLLNQDFIKWVLIANIFAWPMVWWIMNKWLQDFAYRTSISIWVFVLSGLIALGIALLTVSYQATVTATANPVKSLRYE